MELVQQLVEQLGISEEQAKGGAGLLFSLAKDKLGSGEFSQITDSVPGVDDLIGAAPESGGLVSSLGGLASAFGGKGDGLGNLASLASGFSNLGLDSGMIGKFVPVVLSFIQGQGSDQASNLLSNLFGSGE
jgi:hypothetical protein